MRVHSSCPCLQSNIYIPTGIFNLLVFLSTFNVQVLVHFFFSLLDNLDSFNRRRATLWSFLNQFIIIVIIIIIIIIIICSCTICSWGLCISVLVGTGALYFLPFRSSAGDALLLESGVHVAPQINIVK